MTVAGVSHGSVDAGVELIKSYKPTMQPILHDEKKRVSHGIEIMKYGGLDPVTLKLVPMRLVGEQIELHVVLDNITAAVEAGLIDANNWAAQLFAGEEDLDEFFGQLECYDDCYRINDRWWRALSSLVYICDEEGFISCQDIADRLSASIEEGAVRQITKRAEAAYFEVTPREIAELTYEESVAVLHHNSSVREQARKKGFESDLSVDFSFAIPILSIQSKKVYAKEVTEAEARGLLNRELAKKAPKAVAMKRKPAAQSIGAATGGN